MKSVLFYHENASEKPRPGRKKRKKRNAVIVVIFSLLAAAITAGLILIFITPKFEVTEITVMRAESFFSDEEWWPVEEHDEDYVPNGTGAIDYIIPLDADEADYSIAIINMTVTGRSILNGKTILFRIDNNDGLDRIIRRFVFAGVEYKFGCFSREESRDLQLVVYSKGKSEEEITAAIKDTIIEIWYYDSFHSYSTVYTSCKKAKVTFEN